jgi:hypothetical protein
LRRKSKLAIKIGTENLFYLYYYYYYYLFVYKLRNIYMGRSPNNYSLGTLTTYKKIKEKINKIILIDVKNIFFI